MVGMVIESGIKEENGIATARQDASAAAAV
jgi:hypothetical protein